MQTNCGFKAIKEGLNSLQPLEIIAGSSQWNQRKRLVARRRFGNGTCMVVDYWIGKLKWGIRSRSNVVWFPDGGRWPSSQKLGHSRRCWLCKLKWLLRITDWIQLYGDALQPFSISKHQPKRDKSILGSFESSSNEYLLSFKHKKGVKVDIDHSIIL